MLKNGFNGTERLTPTHSVPSRAASRRGVCNLRNHHPRDIENVHLHRETHFQHEFNYILKQILNNMNLNLSILILNFV